MVYGEARGESYEGQVAVAAVAVNRSLSGKFPSNLCAVVRQPRQFIGYRKQAIPEGEEKMNAYVAAMIATFHYDSLPFSYKKVLYFQAGKAGWHRTLKLIGCIENHKFYGG